MFERHFDIVVAGGGVAGIAAAVAAGRRGMKTVLLEKTVLPGGLATAGLIYIYLPLCDGNGTQVSFGITEEMLRRSIQYGPGEIPPGWRSAKNAPEAERFRVVFSPASFILGLDEMLEEANVEVWYDTVVTGTVLEGERLAKVAVSNKSGSGMLSASCFVDATGDADLAALSGLPCIEGKNALACWTLEYREGKGNLAGDCALAMLGFASDPEGIPAGISGRTVSEFVISGRRRYRELLTREYREGKADRLRRFPLVFPAMAQLRHTRCVEGRKVLEPGEEWTRFEDSVGLIADWRKSGFVWEVPYGALLPRGLRGMLAAGRCASARGDAWEVARVIPAAALTGEVAGVAAAQSVAAGIAPDELPVGDLQKELRDRCGFPLHFDELGIGPVR